MSVGTILIIILIIVLLGRSRGIGRGLLNGICCYDGAGIASVFYSLSGFPVPRGSELERQSTSRTGSCALTIRLACIAWLALQIVDAGKVEALPAFTVQTGPTCSACHVGGFGPSLTPFGREF